jgi:excisionase family DNA binding protein
MQAPMLIPVTEAARLLSLGRTRIYELIDAGDLEARKLGKLTMITMDSVRRFVDGLPRK